MDEVLMLTTSCLKFNKQRKTEKITEISKIAKTSNSMFQKMPLGFTILLTE